MSGVTTLVLVGAVMFAVLGGVTLLAHIYSLNNIKSRTVGDGQHGAEIIVDNTQLTIFGGFAPQSSSAETLSKARGSR